MNRALLVAACGAAGYAAYRALKPRYDFRNRHIVITGGSRGLGLVLARQLEALGARLSICSRDPDELDRAEAELAARGSSVYAAVCDVTDRERVREFLSVAALRNGPIDVLINNAGVIRVGPMEAMTDEDYEHSLKTHFWATYNTCNEVLPAMKARGAGRIVNIARSAAKSRCRTCSPTRPVSSPSSASPRGCAPRLPKMASSSRRSAPASCARGAI